ncbi:MAG TPA: MarR family transcriptional regulator [Bacteroidia bacterium]|nr:MarR family transcriptional regulator [Bacteroidia bacterium]
MVKEEIKDQFVTSMLRFVNAVKGESEACSEICGGFNEKEMQVIVFVGQHTNVKMTEISENLNSPLSTLTSVVDKLVEKKFLTRVHSDEDRRVVNVALTIKGKNSFKTFLDRKDEMADKILSQYNTAEQVNFIEYLGKMSSTIESMR